MDYQERNETVRRKLSIFDIDGILVTRPENIFYLVGVDGIEGSYFLYRDGATLFTDFRYIHYLQGKECFFDIFQYKQWMKDLSGWLSKNGFKKIGFESGHLTVETHNHWKKELPNVNFIPCRHVIEDLRLVKDNNEQEMIRKSARILSQVMNKVPQILRDISGITEKALAIELEYLIKKAGAQRSAFDIIVATGERSAFPHALPTENIVEREDLLLIDCGAVYQGYHSDMTRVMVIKTIFNQKIREIYNIVREAQNASLSSIFPGASTKEIDLAARNVIKKAGFEECFGHGTGHGVGLMIHEDPKINATSETILKKGMVFTVEPGIYLQNEFGIRWEDMVLVTDDGYEFLSDKSWDNLEPI